MSVTIGVHGGVPGHRQGQIEGEPTDGTHHTPQSTASQRGCTFNIIRMIKATLCKASPSISFAIEIYIIFIYNDNGIECDADSIMYRSGCINWIADGIVCNVNSITRYADNLAFTTESILWNLAHVLCNAVGVWNINYVVFMLSVFILLKITLWEVFF